MISSISSAVSFHKLLLFFPYKSVFIPIYYDLCSGSRKDTLGEWLHDPSQCRTSGNISLKHGGQNRKNLEQVHPPEDTRKDQCQKLNSHTCLKL